jgi:Lipid-droplet associated hydrolase
MQVLVSGHDEPKKELKMIVPPLEGNESLYDLQGQVKHKSDFIKKFIPKSVKVHIVGHSIGSKIILELLKDEEISQQVHQSYLLFPTIEKMVESKNGFWFYEVFNKIFFLLQFFYYAFHYLPLTVRTIILYGFCWLSSFPKFFLGTVIKASSPTALDKIWFMAQDEMKKVRKIDEETIKANMNRIKFYYGTTDGWVPTYFYHELIKKFPGIDAELCTEKIDHGFVVSHGPRMARMVSDWIRRLSVSKSN